MTLVVQSALGANRGANYRGPPRVDSPLVESVFDEISEMFSCGREKKEVETKMKLTQNCSSTNEKVPVNRETSQIEPTAPLAQSENPDRCQYRHSLCIELLHIKVDRTI